MKRTRELVTDADGRRFDMLKDGFLRFCNDPELACCRAEKELGQLRIENENLHTQLAKSRERERAAVRDLIALAHKYGDCEFCAWRDDKGHCAEPNPGDLCAEHYKMKWRGPAGEGGEQ